MSANENAYFSEIYEKVEELNLSYQEMRGCSALMELIDRADGQNTNHRSEKKHGASSVNQGRGKVFAGVVVSAMLLLVVAVTVSHPYRPIPRAISSALVYFAPKEMSGDQCLVRAPGKFADWFRPVVNCSICRGLQKVDSVNDISVEEFTAKYAYSSRPLVVRGAMKNWTASSTFSFDFFRKLYLKQFPGSLDVLNEHCQFFHYKTEFRNLREVLTMSKKRFDQMWYIGFSNCDVAVADELRRHYARPAFLPVGSESSRYDWIFMGRPGYGANMHVDNVGRSSWQAQIRGIKEWTLQPPPECYFECSTLKVVINPNDIIVVDTDTWYHSTLILGTELSITIGSEFD
ncbi:uncharacterized protein LOC129594087 [Paramacrobiotus metropolitanus]|uniref:uncharacterized protein LOC129594087 n=1 Tax=Paramacrobiotus metropolitanus TaxID=2943436 RepID=UPI002445E50E|nr:uncharacterized protein LOC129594087 [Paramacrobiotus metropolitanus]